MSIQAILLPLLVQVGLTFVLLFWSGRARLAVIRRGEVREENVSLRQPSWPKRELQLGYSYESQLELPLLFYLLTVVAVLTRQADLLFVVMAWLFVALRIVHASIHVTSNRLAHRSAAFAAGAVVLALMWLILGFRILVV
jgi:hypothetical protein